jgi:tetratricopeptide (TPR) repeat protein
MDGPGTNPTTNPTTNSTADTEPGPVRNLLTGLGAGQVVQAGSVNAVHFHVPGPRGQDRAGEGGDHRLGTPAQLPMRPRRFVGREDELATLNRWRVEHADTPMVAVLTGPGGVGKTSLALRWLHDVRGEFPDGSLYSELGGDGLEPVSPGRVLGWFLESLGVPGERVPADPAHRAALFRSVTADRRLAVCLDNAVSAAQVRPLLPAGSANVVVVTSRSRLTGLAMDGATFLDVEPMDEAGALTVLAELVGTTRTTGEPDASRRLVHLCGGLPLAVSIVGARLAARPRRQLGAEARSLVDDRQRLALSVVGDQPVAAVFDVSYRGLDGPARLLYRTSSCHPGREFGVAVLAAALGWDEATTSAAFTRLVDISLLSEVDDQRYAFHDLVRAHARQCADAEGGTAAVPDTTRRMASWYLARAVAADLVVHPLRPHVGPLYEENDQAGEAFDDEHAAISWLVRERANLLAVVDHAWQRGWDEIAWQMSEALGGLFLRARGYADWIGAQSTGIASAQRCGNQRAEARLRSQLGFAHAKLGRFDDAIAENTRALAIAEAVGDGQARATALSQLGRAARGTGDLPAALAYFHRALRAHEELGRPRGVALNRRRIGDILTRMGEPDAAVVELRASADAMAALGDRIQHARSLQYLGAAHHLAGHHQLTDAVLREAWTVVSGLESPYYQAEVLGQLGEVAEQRGDRAAAIDAYRRAGELYEGTEDPRTDEMRARVAALAEG